MASPSDLLDTTHPWPAAAFTTTPVGSSIFCLWLYPTFQGLAFFRGLPQLCFTCTSASDNQSSFHSSAAPESTPTFFSPRVQLGFIQQERAEVAMCALHATHSGRQILCNPTRDDLNCWIIDLKAWTEIWGGRSLAILPRIPLSPLPLCCFFASQLAWTHPHAQGTPACSRGQGKTNEDLCYSSSDTEYVAGSSKTAIRWIPPGHCGRALARYSSATSSCLHDFLKWLFPPYLWDPVPTWSNFTQAGGQWGKKIRDMETNHETHKGQWASPSRPLWPGLSTQSLTSAVALSVRAEGRFCCPYSSNSSSEIFSLGNCCLWHKAALPAGETY